MDGKQFKMGAPGGGNRRSYFKNAGFLALIILFGLVIYSATKQSDELKTVPFSQVISQANEGQIKQITVEGSELKITYQGQTKPSEKAFKEAGTSLAEQGLKPGKTI